MNNRKLKPIFIIAGGLLFLMLVGALASYFGKQVAPAANGAGAPSSAPR